MENNNIENSIHNHSEHDHCCDCHDSHHFQSKHVDNDNIKNKYKDFQFDDNTDDSCDLDPSKICDNCGKCLDTFNTDKEGYVQIAIDKIDKGNSSLYDLYKMYGLDED